MSTEFNPLAQGHYPWQPVQTDEGFTGAAEPAGDPATDAADCTALMFTPLDFADARPGMTVRLQNATETVVSIVRLHAFSAVDEQLVVDGVYPNALLVELFANYRISVLVQTWA